MELINSFKTKLTNYRPYNDARLVTGQLFQRVLIWLTIKTYRILFAPKRMD